MINKKYQIFVSSTFRDLIEERQAVLEAILEMNHIPCGMEAFPASSATPWELIKNMIDDSDYYLLVIGGRYGSLSEEGISYTEMEYDYADEKGKAILCFLHQFPDKIPVGKSEVGAKIKKKLSAFRDKAGRQHVKYWADKDDLKSKAIIALNYAFVTNSQRGWIRNDEVDKTELLKQLNDLRNKFDSVLVENAQLKETISNESLETTHLDLEIPISFSDGYTGKLEINSTLNEIIFGIGSLIINSEKENDIKEGIKNLLKGNIKKHPEFNKPGNHIYSTASINRIERMEINLDLVKGNLIAQNIIEINIVVLPASTDTRSRIVNTWSFTKKGLNLYLEKFSK